MVNITGSKMVIFSGRSNRPIAEDICSSLRVKLGKSTNKDFKDGENWISLDENVRSRDVFLIQSTCQPDKNIIELLLMIDAAKRASAARITAVIPYYGYGRQDRKDESRTPISAKVMANLITVAGANRVITMDLHAGQIQGFFDIPVDNLYAKPVMTKFILKKFVDRLANLGLASPDVGGIKRTRSYAKKINNAPLVIIDKRREEANKVEVMNIIGKVRGKDVVVIDDVVDTASTLVKGANALIEKGGAKAVHSICIHPVLSAGAVELIANSKISSLTVTDTIPLSEEAKNCSKIQVVSVAELIAGAIDCSRTGKSISKLFL